MLDVALVSLIQDMSEKAGVEGTIQYWARVGESLAKRMGKEAYMGWPSFNVALREGRTAFSVEGSVTASIAFFLRLNLCKYPAAQSPEELESAYLKIHDSQHSWYPPRQEKPSHD